MAQMPNRVGNKSARTPSHIGGATAVTRPQGDTKYAPGRQGAPAANGNIASRNQKVQVHVCADYDGKIRNDGYMNSDRTNYLK